MKILDVLNRENWIKGSLATDANHNPVAAWSPQACHFCFIGAAIRVYGIAHACSIELRLANMVGFVSDWNDDADRTWEEVEAVIQELGI